MRQQEHLGSGPHNVDILGLCDSFDTSYQFIVLSLIIRPNTESSGLCLHHIFGHVYGGDALTNCASIPSSLLGKLIIHFFFLFLSLFFVKFHSSAFHIPYLLFPLIFTKPIFKEFINTVFYYDLFYKYLGIIRIEKYSYPITILCIYSTYF